MKFVSIWKVFTHGITVVICFIFFSVYNNINNINPRIPHDYTSILTSHLANFSVGTTDSFNKNTSLQNITNSSENPRTGTNHSKKHTIVQYVFPRLSRLSHDRNKPYKNCSSVTGWNRSRNVCSEITAEANEMISKTNNKVCECPADTLGRKRLLKYRTTIGTSDIIF